MLSVEWGRDKRPYLARRLSVFLRHSPQPTPAARAARRTNSLKSTGPRTPEGKLRSDCSLKRPFGRLPAVLRQADGLRRAIDRKMRFTSALRRALGLANSCRPTLPVETPEKREITSTTVSWNVKSNQ